MERVDFERKSLRCYRLKKKVPAKVASNAISSRACWKRCAQIREPYILIRVYALFSLSARADLRENA